MASVIYLEAAEEITSVVDRLRGLGEKEATLVVPKGAILLQSVVNLKLLQRQSAALGKTVSIVTTDRMGKNLAAQVGFATFDSLDDLEAGKAFHPTRTAGVMDIGPRPRAAATPRAATPPTQPSAPARANKSPFMTTPVEDEPQAKPEPTPALEPADQVPEIRPPKATRGRSRRPKFALPGLAMLRLPKKLPGGRNLIYAGAGLVIIIAALLLLFVFPTATIAVTPKADPLAVSKDVIVDATASSISTASPLIIPGKSGEKTADGSDSFPATGTKDIGNRATGTVTIKNCEDSSTHTLPAGSTLTRGGQNFGTNSTVTIPAAIVAGGTITCGSTSAGITAKNAGTDSNFGSGSFTVPLSGNFTATGSTSGGTSNKVTVVSQSDVDDAKAKLQDKLYGQAKDQLSSSLGNLRLLDDALQKSIVSATPSPAVSEQASQFTLSMKVLVKGLGFKESDLEKVLLASTKANLGSDKQIITDKGQQADVTVSQADVTGGTLSLHATLNAWQAPKYDARKLASEVKGRTIKSAQSYFQSQSQISQVQISVWPSFKGRLPYFASRIKVEQLTPSK